MTATIDTLPELLAYARALESEAVERYEDLAEQMETHHNLELAELFRKMAAIEQQHVDQVQTLAAAAPLPPWRPGTISGMRRRRRKPCPSISPITG